MDKPIQLTFQEVNPMQAVKPISSVADTSNTTYAFKRCITGWVIAALNTLSAVNSSFFFLGQIKTGVIGWLMLNSCTPSIALFLAGFLTGSPIVMAAAVWLLRYGFVGLFVFPWDSFNLIAQVGHLLMTAAAVYVIVEIIRHKRWRALWTGALIGVAVLVPFMIIQGLWLTAHPEVTEALFDGKLMP